MGATLTALWRAVLLQALHDAAAGADAGWIGSRDFAVTCHLAGLDPGGVRRAFRADPARFRNRRALRWMA